MVSENADISNKSTLIIGASVKPDRYSHIACLRLVSAGYPVFLLGKKKGKIGDSDIHVEPKEEWLIHTVTLYIRPEIQELYFDYLVDLAPKRIIFNPGTENPILRQKLETADIQILEACTLVMLSTGLF